MDNVYIPINALEPSPNISQIFMIEKASQRYGGNRKPYIVLKLRDVTGHIYGRIWDTKLNSAIDVGKFIIITGKVETYGKELQIIANNWQPFNGTPENLSDYVYCPNPNVIKVYLEELESFIDTVQDSDYRNIVRNALERLELIKRMSESPYGFEGRLAYRGGLLMHSVYLLRMLNNLFSVFNDTRSDLNRDLLIVGAVFRNLGWWAASLQRGNIFVPGKIAKLLGIRFASAMICNHACIGVESDMCIKIDLEKKLKLQQIALAENGMDNLTPEALMLIDAESIINNVEFSI